MEKSIPLIHSTDVWENIGTVQQQTNKCRIICTKAQKNGERGELTEELHILKGQREKRDFHGLMNQYQGGINSGLRLNTKERLDKEKQRPGKLFTVDSCSGLDASCIRISTTDSAIFY